MKKETLKASQFQKRHHQIHWQILSQCWNFFRGGKSEEQFLFFNATWEFFAFCAFKPWRVRPRSVRIWKTRCGASELWNTGNPRRLKTTNDEVTGPVLVRNSWVNPVSLPSSLTTLPARGNISASNQQEEELRYQGIPRIVPVSPVALGEAQEKGLEAKGMTLTDFIFLRKDGDRLSEPLEKEKKVFEVFDFIEQAKREKRKVLLMTFSSMPVGLGSTGPTAQGSCL
eukprot:symbB.v1.2.017491.t1/scaffold1367.1/size123183/3